MTKTVPVTCNKDCGGGCPLLAETEDDRVVRVIDNPLRPPDMKGCVRGYLMPNVTHDAARIRKPLIRTGARGSSEFREADWDEALFLVVDRLSEVKSKWGATSILCMGGSGSCRGAVHNTGTLTKRFLSLFGGYTDKFGGYSAGAQGFALPYVFGDSDAGIDPETLTASKLVILWGANFVDTRFGSDFESVMRRMKNSGVPFIVLDPRRSRTVKQFAEWWIPIYPGSDTAVMSAVLFVLIEEGLVNREFIHTYTSGFRELESYVKGESDGTPKTPEWASSISGVDAGDIRTLARRYGAAKPAALIPGLSIQRTVGGEEAIRMAVALQAATGNIGVPGGSPGFNFWGSLPKPKCGRITVPPNKDNPRIPAYRWPDAILGEVPVSGAPGTGAPGKGTIRAVYFAGSNMVSTGSDIKKNQRAMESLEFSVCHDYALTPTARRSDVVLPATTFFERSDIVFPAGNYVFYSTQAIPPVAQARNDYDIFAELADRLGFGHEYTEGRSADEWIGKILAESEIEDIDEFKRTGIYDGGDHSRIGLREFIEDPLAHPLTTPSGKIEVSSKSYGETGAPVVPQYRGERPNDRYPLMLISPHARYRINSQYATEDWALKREPQLLAMSVADAEARGIEDGDTVRVESADGALTTQVSVTDEIMRGVACLLAGMWPSVESAEESSGAANFVTSTVPTMPSSSSRTHTIFVEIAKR